MTRRSLLGRLLLLALPALAGCPAATTPTDGAPPPANDKSPRKDDGKDKDTPKKDEEPIRPPRHDPGR